MRLLWLAFAIACSTPIEARYTATYDVRGSWRVPEDALEATFKHGLAVTQKEYKTHFLAFLAAPLSVDETGGIQLGFVVHVVYVREAMHREEWTVVVQPKAFQNGTVLSDDRLPANAQSEASALAAEIRAYARSREAPPL